MDGSVNLTQYQQTFQTFVHLFQKENKIVQTALLKEPQQQQRDRLMQTKYVTMPLNCNAGRLGMTSYPSYTGVYIRDKKRYNSPRSIRMDIGEVRMMVYPMIDLIYMACDAANVSCGHLYLHRPPEQMLESTVVHTGYHTSLIEAIVVYTSFLERIESDLRKYNHRTWGCISFYDDDVIESLSQLETIGKNKHQHQHQLHGLNTTVNTNKTQNKIGEENIDYPSWFNIVAYRHCWVLTIQ